MVSPCFSSQDGIDELREGDESPLVGGRARVCMLSRPSYWGLRTCALGDSWTVLADPSSVMLRNLCLSYVPCSVSPIPWEHLFPHRGSPTQFSLPLLILLRGNLWTGPGSCRGQESVTDLVVSWFSPDAVPCSGLLLEAARL